MSTIKKVLVANRGEIACRVLRAARELGLGTVAVYADQDRESVHLEEADECFPLEGRAPGETYLDIEKLLGIARRSGSDAVHPGYGFHAENAAFAAACDRAGLRFVGPPAAVLRISGDKLEARERVAKAGVPVLESHRGPPSSFAAAARRIGFPLLVKAAAGGGGRGIRRVEEASRLEESARAASREAEAFFGSGEVYLEREVPRARHVEVQVLADAEGRTVHLFERDCSIQRRHQKIIEESPSPALAPDLRHRMTEAAVASARAVGYRNAGTVEFLLEVDASGRPGGFFFLELNARIQVEHPVTELLTGEDLVLWQLRIAAGERLPERFERLEARGHAIECRITAERPPGFLPSSGRILRLDPPRGPGIRFDGGYRTGGAVPAEFDSLIGKAIARASGRDECIARLIRALEASAILGIDTNVDFLRDILDHPGFRSGAYTTRFIPEAMSGWEPPSPSEDVLRVAREARERRIALHREGGVAAANAGPWERLGSWTGSARAEGGLG